MISFIVKTDGSISEIKAISGPKPLRAESIRMITASGKWIPAKDKGIVVESYCRQPFKFVLQAVK